MVATTIDKDKESDDDTMAEIVSLVHISKMADSIVSNNINNNNDTISKRNGKPKEKRRNNEKRKERSRDAARCRRSRESEIFGELAQELPLKLDDVNQLDKASVMRIAIAYLKVRNILTMFPAISHSINNSICDQFDENTNDKLFIAGQNGLVDDCIKSSTIKNLSSVTNNFDINLLQQALDGFLLILSQEGDIIYITDNISDYLGIAKVDILGQPIWEFAHQCDHAELKEIFNIKRNNSLEKIKHEQLDVITYHCDVFARLKCTLTSRGRNINIKSASYKVIHITGHVLINNKGDMGLVAIGRPIPHPSNIQIPLGSTTFLTKHSLDLKFTYADEKMFDLMGYTADDLRETTIFDCHHGNDSTSLRRTFKNVISIMLTL